MPINQSSSTNNRSSSHKKPQYLMMRHSQQINQPQYEGLQDIKSPLSSSLRDSIARSYASQQQYQRGFEGYFDEGNSSSGNINQMSRKTTSYFPTSRVVTNGRQQQEAYRRNDGNYGHPNNNHPSNPFKKQPPTHNFDTVSNKSSSNRIKQMNSKIDETTKYIIRNGLVNNALQGKSNNGNLYNKNGYNFVRGGGRQERQRSGSRDAGRRGVGVRGYDQKQQYQYKQQYQQYTYKQQSQQQYQQPLFSPNMEKLEYPVQGLVLQSGQSSGYQIGGGSRIQRSSVQRVRQGSRQKGNQHNGNIGNNHFNQQPSQQPSLTSQYNNNPKPSQVRMNYFPSPSSSSLLQKGGLFNDDNNDQFSRFRAERDVANNHNYNGNNSTSNNSRDNNNNDRNKYEDLFGEVDKHLERYNMGRDDQPGFDGFDRLGMGSGGYLRSDDYDFNKNNRNNNINDYKSNNRNDYKSNNNNPINQDGQIQFLEFNSNNTKDNNNNNSKYTNINTNTSNNPNLPNKPNHPLNPSNPSNPSSSTHFPHPTSTSRKDITFSNININSSNTYTYPNTSTHNNNKDAHISSPIITSHYPTSSSSYHPQLNPTGLVVLRGKGEKLVGESGSGSRREGEKERVRTQETDRRTSYFHNLDNNLNQYTTTSTAPVNNNMTNHQATTKQPYEYRRTYSAEDDNHKQFLLLGSGSNNDINGYNGNAFDKGDDDDRFFMEERIGDPISRTSQGFQQYRVGGMKSNTKSSRNSVREQLFGVDQQFDQFGQFRDNNDNDDQQFGQFNTNIIKCSINNSNNMNNSNNNNMNTNTNRNSSNNPSSNTKPPTYQQSQPLLSTPPTTSTPTTTTPPSSPSSPTFISTLLQQLSQLKDNQGQTIALVLIVLAVVILVMQVVG